MAWPTEGGLSNGGGVGLAENFDLKIVDTRRAAPRRLTSDVWTAPNKNQNFSNMKMHPFTDIAPYNPMRLIKSGNHVIDLKI